MPRPPASIQLQWGGWLLYSGLDRAWGARDGNVVSIAAVEGANVEAGFVLVTIE